MESTWSITLGVGFGSDWFDVASGDGNTSTEVGATDEVDSGGKSATGATSTEEHNTSIDDDGVDREKSDIIEFFVSVRVTP